MSRVGVIGQGVIGCSTALALLEKFPKLQVTLYGNCAFKDTCSFGPAGLFRLDKYEAKEWARKSFERFNYLEKRYGHESGVKLLSGHIQSDSRELLESQEKNMADIVYNFRWLTDREIHSLFDNPSKYCIHYTAYASEGRTYVPWMMKRLEELGARFLSKEFSNLDEVVKEGHDVVVNCAGLNGGRLAGDDDSVVPNRGITLVVDAPWHKHFNYRDTTTFTIPMNDCVAVGTMKQVGNTSMTITDEDRNDIWKRYLALHPQFRYSRVLSEFIALRPDRKEIRLELQERKTPDGKRYQVLHNYGHGSNGFTLGWGCALNAVELLEAHLSTEKSKI